MLSDRARRDVMLARKVLAGTAAESGKFPLAINLNFHSVFRLFSCSSAIAAYAGKCGSTSDGLGGTVHTCIRAR